MAILHDEGQLTDHRTAMAGAIAARAIARRGSTTLGIVGAGTQARLQARLLARVLGIERVLVWSRNPERARAVIAAAGCDDARVASLPELCEQSDLIVTTTPSTKPLLMNDMIRTGTRIVAVGADSPGKQELDTRLLSRARIVVDSRQQCVDHGEAGWAVRAGAVEPHTLIELGALLQTPIAFGDEEIVVADLTGVAVQDAEIAKCVWHRLAVGSA
jgi:ornithine cyclodeaminase